MSENTDVEFGLAAEILALEIPAACRDGVIDNLKLLQSHAQRVEAFAAAAAEESAS